MVRGSRGWGVEVLSEGMRLEMSVEGCWDSSSSKIEVGARAPVSGSSEPERRFRAVVGLLRRSSRSLWVSVLGRGLRRKGLRDIRRWWWGQFGGRNGRKCNRESREVDAEGGSAGFRGLMREGRRTGVEHMSSRETEAHVCETCMLYICSSNCDLVNF